MPEREGPPRRVGTPMGEDVSSTSEHELRSAGATLVAAKSPSPPPRPELPNETAAKVSPAGPAAQASKPPRSGEESDRDVCRPAASALPRGKRLGIWGMSNDHPALRMDRGRLVWSRPRWVLVRAQMRVGLELSGEDHGSIDSVGSARWARGGFCGLLELGFCAAAGCSQTCRDDARVPSDYRTCNYSRRADNGDDSGRDDSGRDDPGRDDPGGNSAGSASCGTCWYRRSADRSSRADASATRCTASRHRLGRPRCQDGWRHVPSASA